MSENLKTVVTLGGTVDSSFKKIGGAFDEAFGDSVKTVSKLKREQKSLKKQIEKARDSGADVSFLTRQYNDLEQQIAAATKKADAFANAEKVGKKFKGIAGAGAAAAGSIWLGTTALAAATTATNDHTAEMAGLAQSYDMTIEKFQAFDGIAKRAGLNGENMGDMIEELSNKFGEFKALGEQSSVAETFGALGIDANMLDGMGAVEQFEFIMQRLESVQDKQQAASLADILFGGEGNKISTYVRNTGESFADLIKEQEQYVLLSSEGAAGAVKFNNAFKGLTGVVSSGWKEIAGIVGGAFADDIAGLTKKISDFFNVEKNKEELIEGLKTGVKVAWKLAQGMYSLGQTVNSVAQFFGGWQNVMIGVGAIIGAKMIVGIVSLGASLVSITKTLGIAKLAMAAFNVVMTMNPIGLVVVGVAALIAAGVALYKNWDSVTAFFGRAWGKIKETVAAGVEFIKEYLGWTPLGMILNAWEPVTDYFSKFFDKIGKGFKIVGTLASKLNPFSSNNELTVKHQKALQSQGLKVVDKAAPTVQSQGLKVVDKAAPTVQSQGLKVVDKAAPTDQSQGLKYQSPDNRAASVIRRAASVSKNTVHQKVEKIEGHLE